MDLNKIITAIKPSVSKNWLLVLAGATWTGVGVLLWSYAYTWLSSPFTSWSIIFGLLGVAVSIIAFRIQFSKIANKNVKRIILLPEKVCLFSFVEWKGYLIIAVMMTAGILMRNSSIPKPYLAIVYSSIGGALFLSSFHYYFHLCHTLAHK